MKQYTILTIVPALALLAVGCSTPTSLQTSEYDDMYYSSSDKTEYVQPAATAQANNSYESLESPEQGGVMNPEYSDNSAIMNEYEGDEYYDGRTYDPRDNWYQPSHSYVDPYWGSAYSPVTGRHYQTMAMMSMRDPFFNPYHPYLYDPFYYDPFFSPYHRPFRSGFSMSISFGSMWGSPYAWGHPYSYWGSPFASRFYGAWSPYHGYYNGFNRSNHYGRNQYVYDIPGNMNPRKVQYGPRQDRSSLVTGGSGVTGRPDRGSLSSENEQNLRQGAERSRRPSRTGNVGTEPGNTNSKRVITTRPGEEINNGRVVPNRPQRGQRNTNPVVGGQERTTPIEGARPARTRGNYMPGREGSGEQPTRQQVRPIIRQERSTPVRSAPVRSSEVRPAPVRSSGSSGNTGSSGSSSEKRSGGRPTRGGN